MGPLVSGKAEGNKFCSYAGFAKAKASSVSLFQLYSNMARWIIGCIVIW